MDWFNLHIPTTGRSPEYVGSSPAERGTWLSVMIYACQIECGGRIEGAASWKDRQWQQAAGVTLDEVMAADRLLRFDGADLIVNGYPAAAEKQVRKNRKSAKAGGMAKWAKARAAGDAESLPGGNADTMPPGIAKEVPPGNAKGEGEGEGKGEGKGEGEGNTQAADAAFVARQPDGLLDDQPQAMATTASQKPPTIADIQVLFPALLVTRDDRERMATLLRLYEYAPLAEGLTDLSRAASKREASRRRVFVGELSDWLKANFTPDADDYRRAGLPVPPEAP